MTQAALGARRASSGGQLAGPARRLAREAWRFRWCYLLLFPSAVLTCMFTLYPTVMSWYFSFLDWSGFTDHSSFVGLGNYREIVHDSMFWHAFGRSFIFVLVAVPIRLGLSLLVAIVLNNQALRLSPLFRTLFFLPVVTTAAIIGVVMSLVLSPFHGPVDQVLHGLHLIDRPIDFLGNPHTSLWTVLGVDVWKGFGITMVYWLAALQTIPRHYYEAAQIDGAGRFQVVRHITLPILLPFAAIITLLTANHTLHVFGIVQAMTAGGPFFSSQVMEVYIYQTAFAPENGGLPRLGYASAAGCLFGISVMLLAILQVWIGRKVSRTRASLAGG